MKIPHYVAATLNDFCFVSLIVQTFSQTITDFDVLELEVLEIKEYVTSYLQLKHNFFYHGLINLKDTKTKVVIKKLICKGILSQVFIRVYRLEIQPH